MRTSRLVPALILLALVICLLPSPVWAQGGRILETQILGWTGSAWSYMAKGSLKGYSTALTANAIIQTTDTGNALSVSRDKAAANTNSPLAKFLQDNVGDDQVVLYVKQDATTASTKIMQLVGASAADVFTVDIEGDTVAAGSLTAASGVITAACTFGGGYGSTGTTISTAGVGQFNGALTTDGVITALASTIAGQTVVAETTNARVCTSADYGKLIVFSVADVITITLPANGAAAGSMIDMMIVVENGGTATISPATADTLVTANSTDSDAVTFASGHRIGAYARFISVDIDGAGAGTPVWTAINLGQTTMGVTDTD